MEYAPLTGLPCLVSVGEHAPSPAETLCARVGGNSRWASTLTEEKEREDGERVSVRRDQKGAALYVSKLIFKQASFVVQIVY